MNGCVNFAGCREEFELNTKEIARSLKRALPSILFALPRTILLGLTLATSLHAASDYDQKVLNEIGIMLDELYEGGLIPNYVVDIRKDGRKIYFAARGTTELGGGIPVSEDSIYMLASMSKPIVSSAILRLIDEGKLGLDDELATYLPQFSSMLVAPNGSFDQPFEEAKRPITIRHLLTHTSGFTYTPAVLGVGDVAEQYSEVNLLFAPSAEEFLDILSQLPLVAHPGEAFHYSVSIDVLGAIIEKLTNKRLGDYLREVIFEPLGMDNTAFYVPQEKRKLMPRIYGPATPNNPAPFFENDPIKWQIAEVLYFGLTYEQIGPRGPIDSGGGGLYSSSSDFGKYTQMVANGGTYGETRIMSARAASLHFQNLMPNLGLDAFRANFGDAATYMQFGGGFGIKREEDGSGAADYYFWGGAANTFFWIDGQDKSVGAFFTHIAPPRYNLTDQIEQIVDRARIE